MSRQARAVRDGPLDRGDHHPVVGVEARHDVPDVVRLVEVRLKVVALGVVGKRRDGRGIQPRADHVPSEGAAEGVRGERGEGLEGRELKDAGDRAAHELLMALLAEHRPADAVLSEEGKDDKARLTSSRVWIVDPLDGTREFSEVPRDDWAVHVALWQDGDLVAGAVAFAIPNGGFRHKRVAEELRDEGVKAGVPDICLIHRGEVYFLEMKAARGTLRRHQREMIALLEAAGATCAVARGLDAAVAQLAAWRLLTSQQMENAA